MLLLYMHYQTENKNAYALDFFAVITLSTRWKPCLRGINSEDRRKAAQTEQTGMLQTTMTRDVNKRFCKVRK